MRRADLREERERRMRNFTTQLVFLEFESVRCEMLAPLWLWRLCAVKKKKERKRESIPFAFVALLGFAPPSAGERLGDSTVGPRFF